jgi:serine/threonine protein kinase
MAHKEKTIKPEPKIVLDTGAYITQTEMRNTTTIPPFNEDHDVPIFKRKLVDAKYAIYLVFCPKRKRHFAMKVYRYHKNKINPLYIREARVFLMNHSNIISIIDTVNAECISQNNEFFSVSYILFELARCDFVTLIQNRDFINDDKLVRTYFHQLIKGIEYLHAHEICHMDLKAENLLLGEDLQLKVADFDLCFKRGDKVLMGNGSPGFRAPEVKDKKCSIPELADIYSLGIILYVLRVGSMPYAEDKVVKGYDLYRLLMDDQEKFWEAQKKLGKITDGISQEFKELFFSMVMLEPEERATFPKIKKNKWYQGEIYTKLELREKMRKFMVTEWILAGGKEELETKKL